MSDQNKLDKGITLCGIVDKIEKSDTFYDDGKYLVHMKIGKGVIKDRYKESNPDGILTIPLMVSSIVVIKSQKALNLAKSGLLELSNTEVLGLSSELKVGDKYYISAQLCKVNKTMGDGSTKRITHIDAKEIYKVPENYIDINRINGKFKLTQQPTVKRTTTNVYSTLRLCGLDNYKPRIVAYSKGKNATYTGILDVGDEIELTGSLSRSTYTHTSDNGIRDTIDSFSVYVNKIIT